MKKIKTKVIASLLMLNLVLTLGGFGASVAVAQSAPMVNICHKTSSETNPWEAITISENALHTHDDHHEDYAGPTDENITFNEEWCIDNAPTTTPDPEDGKVHIIKYIDGERATPENANNTSFPMITPTYNNAPFTLDADGHTSGDEPYEATTSTIVGGNKYTAHENLSTQTVGESCDDSDNPAYALVGYTTGDTLEEAEDGDPSTNAPEVTVDGDQYIIVWNEDCEGSGGVGDPETVTVTIAKYLELGEVDAPATALNTDSTSFPMNSSWDADNIGAGAGSYQLDSGNSYTAVTSDMTAGADYTTSENLTGQTVGATCSEDANNPSYVLVGYSSGNTLIDAVNGTRSLTAPNFTNLQSDKFVVVWNEKCGEIPQCNATATSTIVSDTVTTDGDGNASALTFVHPGWTASIPGATWIWATDPVESPTNDTDLTKTFTRTFNIVGTPTSGTLDIAADNSYTVKVNGNTVPVIFDQNNFQAGTQDSYDVTSFLVSGSNTLEIMVTNKEDSSESADPAVNPAGLLYKLSLGNNECVTPPPPVDVCTNIDGNQSELPANHYFESAGICMPNTPDPTTVKVTIVKYLDVEGDTDVAATPGNTNSASFSMNAVFPGGSGNYELDADGFNGNPTAYQAITSDMALGSNYSTSENFNSVVGASCVEGNNTPQYKLVGYKTGENLADALDNALSLTAPSFTNLQSDKFVVVINDQCPGDISENPTSADLSVTKTVSDGTPDENQSITYTITVTNNGPVNATGIVVTDLLPSGLTYSSHSTVTGSYVSGTGVWTIGNLANGASAVLTITATVNGNTAGDTINNTATVDGDQADNDAEDNSATVSAEVNGGGGGSSSSNSSSGSSRRSRGSSNNTNGQVLGAQTSSTPSNEPGAFFPQVLGAQIGLPYTSGGNYIMFGLILALSGLITLISLAYLSTNRRRDEMEF